MQLFLRDRMAMNHAWLTLNCDINYSQTKDTLCWHRRLNNGNHIRRHSQKVTGRGVKVKVEVSTNSIFIRSICCLWCMMHSGTIRLLEYRRLNHGLVKANHGTHNKQTGRPYIIVFAKLKIQLVNYYSMFNNTKYSNGSTVDEVC